MSLHFSDENWERILDSWLLILAHFAKYHIDLNASLNSCIYNLKCAHFVYYMILFLWLLCFRYSFYTFNIFCIFHIICSHLDFITTLKQLWFQKSFTQFDDFIKKVDFSMIFCNHVTLSSTKVDADHSNDVHLSNDVFFLMYSIFFHLNHTITSCLNTISIWSIV